MYHGFPLDLLSHLRCPDDDSELTLQRKEDASPRYVRTGTLRCVTCEREFAIVNGIVRFLDADTLDAESENERLQRDSGAEGLDPSWEKSPWTEMELAPTMEASDPLAGSLVLELGAGTGRHTIPMLRRGATVVAVDFSAVSLANLGERVQAGWQVGLVHADVTNFSTARAAFDLVASTLMSNLPTAAHRSRCMRAAARACKPSGKFVFGTHHYSVRARMRGEEQSGYYIEAPIYRYLFTQDEIRAETQQHFRDIDVHPMQIVWPLAGRLRLPVVRLSRLSERVPYLNLFGELLLVRASQPIALSQAERQHATG